MRSVLITAGLGFTLMNFAFAEDLPALPDNYKEAARAKLEAAKLCLKNDSKDAIKACLKNLKAEYSSSMLPLTK